MTTNHGLIMVFGAIMPAFVGLANWLIPMQVGAPDMALPRMNNLSFWILPFAFGMMISTLFMEGGGPNFGWTFLCAAFYDLCAGLGNVLHFCGAFDGCVLNHGQHQHHRDHLEHARTWYDFDEDAVVRMDLVNHGLSVDRSDACIGRRGNHDVV